MITHVAVGRIARMTVILHYNWFVMAVLLCVSLAWHFQLQHPAWPTAMTWVIALSGGLGFFLSILLHELSHALVARARQMPVRSVMLYAFGGATQIDREVADAKTELLMGVAGPIVSAGLAALCFAVSSGGVAAAPMPVLLGWLGAINAALAAFNMVPGFPLDGGRILRALLWWITGQQDRATRIAATLGQWVATAMTLAGVAWLIAQPHPAAFWMIVVGLFVLDTAQESYAQTVRDTPTFQGLQVRDVMSCDYLTVDAQANLQTFATKYLFRTGRTWFVVSDHGQAAGLVTPDAVRQIDRGRWAHTSLDAVMRPLDQLPRIEPDMPLFKAFDVMRRSQLNQLPVVSEGRLHGVLARGYMWQALQEHGDVAM